MKSLTLLQSSFSFLSPLPRVVSEFSGFKLFLFSLLNIKTVNMSKCVTTWSATNYLSFSHVNKERRRKGRDRHAVGFAGKWRFVLQWKTCSRGHENNFMVGELEDSANTCVKGPCFILWAWFTIISTRAVVKWLIAPGSSVKHSQKRWAPRLLQRVSLERERTRAQFCLDLGWKGNTEYYI